MEQEDLVTIIVPVYNTAKFLNQCLHSILRQTYKNIELIVIDDGSTDESVDICEEIQRNDQRISVIHQRNSGVSVARNNGVDVAKGEWIIFVDSDDFIDLEMVEKLYNAVKKYDADYAVCGYACVSEEQKLIKEYVSEKEMVISPSEALKMHYLGKYTVNYVTQWGKIMRRNIWENLRFTQNIFYEDLEIMPKLLLKCNKIVVLNYIGYRYVQREGSIMHNEKIKDKCYEDAIKFFLQHILFYKEHGLDEIKEANIRLLLDKILTSDLHGTIPIAQTDYSRRVYQEYYQMMDKEKIPLIQKTKYWIYKTFGVKGYRLLSMIKK